MKATTHLLLLLAVLLMGWLVSCDNSRTLDYTVTCQLDSTLHRDSATLLVLEQDYKQLRQCGVARIQGGEVTFTGQTDGPRVALLRFDGDSAAPFYFVLDTGLTQIKLGATTWDVKGNEQNLAYQQFMNARQAILQERLGLWQRYLKMKADSSLKRRDEAAMVERDSVLNDSLFNLMVDRMNGDDMVSVIMRQRFAGDLPPQYASKLK